MPFEINWTAANDALNSAWDLLPGLGDLGEALSGFLAPLTGVLFQILQVIVYPVVLLLNVIITEVNSITYPITLFFGNIIALGGIFYDMVDVFSSVFPSEWTFLLGAIITINLGLRLYAIIPLVGKG